jgi:LEA14-like dessication related protein
MVTSDSVEVTINPSPAVPTITHIGADIYESSAANGNQWYIDGIIVQGDTNQTFDASFYVNRDVYTIVTNAFGCSAKSNEETITGISEVELLQELSIFPNPAKDVLTVKSAQTIAGSTLTISTVAGQVMQTVKIQPNSQITIPVSHLAAGVYILQLHTTKGNATQKLIIE